MTALTPMTFTETDIDQIAGHTGRVAVTVGADGKLNRSARRINKLTKGALERLVASDSFTKLSAGDAVSLGFPTGMAAEAVDVVQLANNADQEALRAAGAALAKRRGDADLLVLTGGLRKTAELCFGLAMRDYTFEDRKSNGKPRKGQVVIMNSKPEEVEAAAAPLLAIADGAFMTRDLTNEPANILTTTEFADRLAEMESIGLEVEVLDEAKLEELGMRTLLSVGQGSASPSYVVVMKWNGGEKDAAPLALVGKGVVFDTGGISLKPGAGMEDMTMDMGGAGVVSGVMRSLALRKAKANVVGLVGIVENMPSSTATRPGDVIKTTWDLALTALGEANGHTSGGFDDGQDPFIKETLARGATLNEWPRQSLDWFHYRGLGYWCAAAGLPAMPYVNYGEDMIPMQDVAGSYNVPARQADGRPGFGDFLHAPSDASQHFAGLDVYLTQGLVDTLFNFNEAWWNFQCLTAAGADVTLLTHNSGHVLPFAQAPDKFPTNSGSCPLDRKGWFDARLKPAGSPQSTDEVCFALESGGDFVKVPADQVIAPQPGMNRVAYVERAVEPIAPVPNGVVGVAQTSGNAPIHAPLGVLEVDGVLAGTGFGVLFAALAEVAAYLTGEKELPTVIS